MLLEEATQQKVEYMDWPLSFLHRTSTQVVGVQGDYWLPNTCCAGLLGVVVVIVVFGGGGDGNIVVVLVEDHWLHK